MRETLKVLLPQGMRHRLRSWTLYQHLQASHLASTSKRIDSCAAQFAHVLSLASHPPLAGKTCLEVGSGWVLSHALVCYLLGANRIIATDLAPQARPGALALAVRKAVPAIPRDILSPFADHGQLRERFERVRRIRRFDFRTLRELGIEYRSPVDFASQPLEERVDFIYSWSVLEHVPCEEVEPLLRNLASMLNSDGTMIHCFHLEDHKNAAKRPFEFLSSPAGQFSKAVQGERGNRLRRSAWLRLVENLSGVDTRFLYSWSREDQPLPKTVDASIAYADEADLRVSHLGTYSRKYDEPDLHGKLRSKETIGPTSVFSD